MKAYLAETLGTLALMFIGMGVNANQPLEVRPLWRTAVAYGSTVAVMVSTIIGLSGGLLSGGPVLFLKSSPSFPGVYRRLGFGLFFSKMFSVILSRILSPGGGVLSALALTLRSRLIDRSLFPYRALIGLDGKKMGMRDVSPAFPLMAVLSESWS